MNRTEILDDARYMVGAARRERLDGFRDRAAECLRVAGRLRQIAQNGEAK